MKRIRTEPHGGGAEGDERIRTAVTAPSADPVYVRRLWWRIDRNRRITRHLGFCRWCGRWGCGDD